MTWPGGISEHRSHPGWLDLSTWEEAVYQETDLLTKASQRGCVRFRPCWHDVARYAGGGAGCRVIPLIKKMGVA